MSHETLARMAQATKPLEKSQTELREIWTERFLSLKPQIEAEVKSYRQALEAGTFNDAPDEPLGAGDQRRETHQAKITSLVNRAEKMKKTLDSGESLPQVLSTFTSHYTHPDGHQETITMDFEAKLQNALDLYRQVNLDIPPDFEDTMRELWQKYQADIEQAITQQGFDELLFLPGNTPLPELKDKLAMEQGYYELSNFTNGGSFAGAKSSNVDKPRLVLAHKAQNLKDRPELKKTLNVKGQDLDQNQLLTLEDYLIFQRLYYAETGQHLDEDGWTWLATRSGARLVNTFWLPSDHQFYVNADDLDYQNANLGARPARCFY